MKPLFCGIFSILFLSSIASAELDVVNGCNPVTTTAASGNVNVPINDLVTITNNLVFSAVSNHIIDVDLRIFVTHPFPSDLDIFLISPAGTRIMITTDNGNGVVNAFNGTLFDDFGPSITDYVFTSGEAMVPLLNPEAPLSRLKGEDPNGIWKLEIRDDASGDTGMLVKWQLDIATCEGPPTTTPEREFASTTSIPITFNSFIQSPIQISGVGSDVCGLSVQTFIQHKFPTDIDMFLRGPGGLKIPISTDNGGSAENSFNGTIWLDSASDSVTNILYANGIVATPISAEDSLASFYQSSADGTWVLEVNDDFSADDGLLTGWSIRIRACGPDTDGDGTLDEVDSCPNDAAKTEPGVCGCGLSEIDTDGDGKPACVDACPTDASKSGPGKCGCGVSDLDTDGDNFPNCIDQCTSDVSKSQPGICGCGVKDSDDNNNGIIDCNQRHEFKLLVDNLDEIFSKLKSAKTKKAKKRQRGNVAALTTALQSTSEYLSRPGANVLGASGGSISDLYAQAQKDLADASKKLSKKALNKARKSINALIAALG